MPLPHADTPDNLLTYESLCLVLPGFDIRLYDTLPSTNDEARRLTTARQLATPGLVITKRQTAGRGQGRNTWWSDLGSLTCTFVFPLDLLSPSLAGLAAGLATRHATQAFAPCANARLKWPNDVLLDERKVAGILGEAAADSLLLGIGVNVNNSVLAAPLPLRETAISLCDVLSHSSPILGVLSAISLGLLAWLARMNRSSDWISEYDRHHILHGRRIVLSQHDQIIRGTCAGIAETGELLVTVDGRIRRIASTHALNLRRE